MDWNFFPPTLGGINDEERSQKINRINMDQLFHNIDALLKRDINDCLSKHLDGLLRNNATIYQVLPSVQSREMVDYFEAGEEAVKCKTVKKGYFSQLALKCPSTSVYKSQSVQTESSCPAINGKPSTRFRSKKPVTSPEICRPTRSVSKNDARKERLKFERIPLTLDSDQYNVSPSNGWWRSERSGESTNDSEAEAEVIKEAKSYSGSNAEIKSNSDHCRPLDVCTSAEGVLENCNDGSETQTRTSSTSSELSKIQGMQSEELLRRGSEKSSLFRLTSGYGDESEIIKAPRPPQPTPDLDHKTYQTFSENNSLSSFSRSTSFASDAAIISEDLELGYKELFHYRLNTKSRLDYNKLKALKHNYSRPDKPLVLKEENSSHKYFDKCVSPNMKASRAKSNKAIPAVLQKQAVKRRPNTANIPVKLRLQHRSNAFKKFNEVKEEISTDERVLPITLNKPTDASFSVMTPYMANVVWSVMDDEKVV